MDNNDLIKEFNNVFGEKKETPVEPYRAVQNQNLINPAINNTDVEKQNIGNHNVDMVNFVNPTTAMDVVPEIKPIVNNNDYGGQNNFNSVNDKVNTNDYQLYDTSGYINDSEKPIVNVSKKTTVNINPELKTVILIALILLIAMFFIPSIFDFIDDLRINGFR